VISEPLFHGASIGASAAVVNGGIGDFSPTEKGDLSTGFSRKESRHGPGTGCVVVCGGHCHRLQRLIHEGNQTNQRHFRPAKANLSPLFRKR
jgi:hypothetical protein